LWCRRKKKEGGRWGGPQKEKVPGRWGGCRGGIKKTRPQHDKARCRDASQKVQGNSGRLLRSQMNPGKTSYWDLGKGGGRGLKPRGVVNHGL